MRHTSRLLLSAATLAIVLIPLAGRAEKTKVVGPPEVAWKDMSFAQKKTYMKTAVQPKMKTLFQEFDGKKFKKFTCETCHGKTAVDRKFKMPAPDAGIEKLPGTPEAFQAKMKAEETWPKWVKFMHDDVEPAMGKLLDVPVYDPKKPVEGAFGCAKCHQIEGMPAAK